jgi:hypothetical protein
MKSDTFRRKKEMKVMNCLGCGLDHSEHQFRREERTEENLVQ